MHGTLGKLSGGGTGLEESERAMDCSGLSAHLRGHTPTEGCRWVAFGPVPVSGWWEAAG